MKTVVVFSHPNFSDSLANKHILNTLNISTLDIEIRNLDQLYPDGKIDVAEEQAALLDADVVVFQHPLYWYSVTPTLKAWMDGVFSYGFAYGAGGEKLKDKKFIHSITTGGPLDSYASTGYNNHTLSALTLHIHQTIVQVKMEYVKLLSSHGNMPGAETDLVAQAQSHGNELISLIKSL